MNIRVALSSLLALSTTTSAFAGDIYGRRGGWDVFKETEYCATSMEFEGPGSTQLTLAKYPDGNVIVLVSNWNWSAKEGERYDVSYLLNGYSYGGGSARGSVNGIRHGFVSSLNPDFAADFAKGSALRIKLGETEIDRLSLDGTAAAMELVNMCLGAVRAEIAAAAREKARWAYLPNDPFAGGAGRKTAPNLPAAPKGNIGNWASTNDYPSRALREQRQGTTRYQLTVGPDGMATDCKIVSTSGHDDLDAAACANAQRRARFSPATDAQGNPTIGTFEQSVRWVLPSIDGSTSDIAAPLRAAQAPKPTNEDQFRDLFNTWQNVNREPSTP